MVATTQREGVELYFDDVGDGSPIVFHTGGCGDSRMWALAGYADALPGHRQILMDHRGHGRSGSPRGVEAHRMGEYVADVGAVLDAANVETAAFAGYSAGASVGFRFAAEHPDRCSALVAIGAVPEPDDDPTADASRAAAIRDVGTRAAIEGLSASESEPAPPWLIDHLSTTETEMFAVLVEAWSTEPNGWDLLAEIGCPTLFIVGAEECDPDAAHRAAARVPQGRAQVLRGFGHLQTFWHAEVTAPLIREFLG